MSDEQIPWVGPKEIAASLRVERPDAAALVMAAQVVAPKTFDRELRSVQFQVVHGATDADVARAAADLYVVAARTALANLGDDPGFDERAMLTVAKVYADEERWVDVLVCQLLARARLAEEVRRAVLARGDRMPDASALMDAIVEACDVVKAELT